MGDFEDMTLAGLDLVMAEGRELALIDVRPLSRHVEGHLPRSISIPIERLEPTATRLIPRRAVPLVLIDEGPATPLAHRAAKALSAMGYLEPRPLAGGYAAAIAAGREPLRGTGLTLALARWAVRTFGIRLVSPSELLRVLTRALVIDCREADEFAREAVPESFCAPGLLALDVLLSNPPDPGQTVAVVGRPALAVLLAQSLKDAGLLNEVVVLGGGLAAWRAQGLSLTRDSRRIHERAEMRRPDDLKRRAERLRSGFGIGDIGWRGVTRLVEDHDRTLYLIDVRTPEEHLAGHLPGFVNIPGGRLLSELERRLPVRGATVILHGGPGVGDLAAASWLLRAGWDRVMVFRDRRHPEEIGLTPDLGETTFLGYLAPRVVACEPEALEGPSPSLAIVDVSRGPGPPRPPATLRSDRAGLFALVASFGVERPNDKLALGSEEPLDALLCGAELARFGMPCPVWPAPLQAPPGPRFDPYELERAAEELEILAPAPEGPPESRGAMRWPGEEDFRTIFPPSEEPSSKAPPDESPSEAAGDEPPSESPPSDAAGA